MSVQDYRNSIAQKYIKIGTTSVPVIVPGANFSNVVIFVDVNDAVAFFQAGSVPLVDTATALTLANYAGLTQGLLLTILQGFFLTQSPQTVYVVTVADSGGTMQPADLQAQYLAFDNYGYFKTAMGATAPKNLANCIAVALLCVNDPLSQFTYGSNDASILSNSPASEALAFPAAGVDVPIVYHPSLSMRGDLVQLGAALSLINSTGTCVGNKLDFLTIVGFSPSGSTSAIVNLSPAQSANCVLQGVAFFTTAGDGSGDVMLEGGQQGLGWQTPKGVNLGARWLESYVDTVSGIEIADYIGQQGVFQNNNTYQGCLNILVGILNLFAAPLVAGQGARLSNLAITAPPYTLLPPQVDGIITVPGAWSALYNDNVRSVVIQGTLYIPAQ